MSADFANGTQPTPTSNGGSPAAAAPSAASAPTSTPVASPAAPVSSHSAPASHAQQPAGGVVSPQGAATSAAAQNQASIRQMLAASGDAFREFGELPDDNAALARLATSYQQLRDYQPLLPHVQDYLRHQEQFRQWQAQQTQQARQQAEQARKWNVPEIKPEWMRLVKLDERTGRYVPVDPLIGTAIADKVNAHAEWRENHFTQLASPNALGYILNEMGLGGEIQQFVQREIQSAREQMQAQTQVQQLVSSKADWLYLKDQAGNTLYDQSGRPVLTPKGNQFAKLTHTLESSGMTDPAMIDYVASQMLDAWEAKQNSAAPALAAPTADPLAPTGAVAQLSAAEQANNALKANTLRQAARTPNHGGSQIPPVPEAPSQAGGFNFASRLREQFKKNGVTSETLFS